MKLSFSTLGCPRWTLKEIVATAKDLGFGGVEIRGIGDKINALEIPEFSDAEIEQTKEKIAQTLFRSRLFPVWLHFWKCQFQKCHRNCSS